MVDSEVPEYQLSIPEVMKAFVLHLALWHIGADEGQSQLAKQLPELS